MDNLRNFLEIPYDELEDLNLEAKEKVARRTTDEELKDLPPVEIG